MHGTTQELVDDGAIIPRRRTTVDDLEFAATWLEAYEGDPADDAGNLTAAATVAAYLRREAMRRIACRNRSQTMTEIRKPGTRVQIQDRDREPGDYPYATIIRAAARGSIQFSDDPESGYLVRYDNGSQVWKREYDVLDVRPIAARDLRQGDLLRVKDSTNYVLVYEARVGQIHGDVEVTVYDGDEPADVPTLWFGNDAMVELNGRNLGPNDVIAKA
jgi:hypothetical protein